MQYDTYTKILKKELVPAMGCTEPIAVAYCSAMARQTLGKVPDAIEIHASGNIIKNVKSVVVPNTGGLKGLPAAALIGVLYGDSSKGLQVISGVTPEQSESLAQEMNIGLDAIAFVDDREENRAEVRANCPGVRVLDERARVADFVGTTTSLGSSRRKMYREEMVRRDAARAFGGDAEAFLRESELHVELVEFQSPGGTVGDKISNSAVQLQPSTSTLISRCLELVNRTNQLTITGRRYTEAEFTSLIAIDCAKAVHVWDKYGDYGIVGFVAWNAARVVELVFSCRVAKKGVERRVLEMLPQGLAIEVTETDRNAPIREIVAQWLEERR